MNNYELSLQEFKGPLDKLLELIEEKKLEITKINLATVTADFLNYLNSLKNVSPKVLADFISIASRLILIKSHMLLPTLALTEEEKTEISDLEDRLRLYKEFKAAEKNVKALWAKKVSYTRDYLLESKEGFYLSQTIFPDELKALVEKICQELIVIFPKIDSGEIRLINFEEKIQELLTRVTKTAEANFSEVTKGRNRTEVVVLFLAVLHLLKDSLIKVSQEGKFADIKMESAQRV